MAHSDSGHGGDHPRSRGVYAACGAVRAPEGGSSPLARGLPVGDGEAVHGGGIIPARAGFTNRSVPAMRTDRDHPRSRGVYHGGPDTPSGRQGSSPLARGLPQEQVRGVGGGGIIPARAGFTSTCARPGRLSTDHPRSRGVYSPLSARIYGEAGSSPLARGLREDGRYRDAIPGIIPARAGFTRPRGRGRPAPPDHPRSRGVYG